MHALQRWSNILPSNYQLLEGRDPADSAWMDSWESPHREQAVREGFLEEGALISQNQMAGSQGRDLLSHPVCPVSPQGNWQSCLVAYIVGQTPEVNYSGVTGGIIYL